MAETKAEAALGRVMGAEESTHKTDRGRAEGASTYHGVELWFQSWPWQEQRGKVSGDEHQSKCCLVRINHRAVTELDLALWLAATAQVR